MEVVGLCLLDSLLTRVVVTRLSTHLKFYKANSVADIALLGSEISEFLFHLPNGSARRKFDSFESTSAVCECLVPAEL